MMKSGGYQEMGDAAALYDLTAAYRSDTEFYLELARRTDGPVLDLGCGTGRILLRLAQEGFRVVGIDFSEPMLEICREKVAQADIQTRQRVDLIHADMVQFSILSRLNLAILPYRSFQYLLSPEDQLSCLRCIHTHLAPDGLIALDVFNPSVHFLASFDSSGNPGDPAEWEQLGPLPDGTEVAIADRITGVDLHQQVTYGTTWFRSTRPNGTEARCKHEYAMRYTFRYELEHLLARAGFDLTELYSDFDRTPYGACYPGELVVIAAKSRGNGNK